MDNLLALLQSTPKIRKVLAINKPSSRCWAMVMGNYGKGKIAVFLGSTLGSGGTGVLPFWEWKEWSAYLSGIIKKLSIQKKD